MKPISRVMVLLLLTAAWSLQPTAASAQTQVHYNKCKKFVDYGTFGSYVSHSCKLDTIVAGTGYNWVIPTIYNRTPESAPGMLCYLVKTKQDIVGPAAGTLIPDWTGAPWTRLSPGKTPYSATLYYAWRLDEHVGYKMYFQCDEPARSVRESKVDITSITTMRGPSWVPPKTQSGPVTVAP